MSKNNFSSEKQIPTRFFAQKIGRCESQQEFEQLVEENISYFKSWEEHINSLMKEKGLNVNIISERCGLSESTARRYLKEIPPKRKYVIEFAVLLKLSYLQTNNLLTRWAKYERLNAKNIEDAIWIFIINRKNCENPEEAFNELKERFDLLIDEIDNYYSCKLSIREKAVPVGTRQMESKILSAQTIIEFENVMGELAEGFKTRNQRLLDYINNLVNSCGNSANELFSEDVKFRNHHYQQLRNLENNKSTDRMYLITLGLKLNCTSDGINDLLEVAGMSPLCSKDKLESAIYFYLEDLYCKCPDSLNGYYNNERDEFAYDLKNIQDDTENGFDELRGFFENEDCYNYILDRLRSSNLELDIHNLLR